MGVKTWKSKSGERYIVERPGTVDHPDTRWGVKYKGRIYASFDTIKEAISYRDELLESIRLGMVTPAPVRKKAGATRAVKRKQAAAVRSIGPSDVKKGCATCRFRGQMSGSAYTCKYYDVPGNRSRVALHYSRTGRESLDGFTSDENCTEYVAGPPLRITFDGDPCLDD